MEVSADTEVDHAAVLADAGHAYRAANAALVVARADMITAIRAATADGWQPQAIARECGWSRAQVNNVRGAVPSHDS